MRRRLQHRLIVCRGQTFDGQGKISIIQIVYLQATLRNFSVTENIRNIESVTVLVFDNVSLAVHQLSVRDVRRLIFYFAVLHREGMQPCFLFDHFVDRRRKSGLSVARDSRRAENDPHPARVSARLSQKQLLYIDLHASACAPSRCFRRDPRTVAAVFYFHDVFVVGQIDTAVVVQPLFDVDLIPCKIVVYEGFPRSPRGDGNSTKTACRRAYRHS